MLLIRALRHRKGARAALRVAGATAWTRRNFARWLFEDYPRAVVATPRRWHRGIFTGPAPTADPAPRGRHTSGREVCRPRRLAHRRVRHDAAPIGATGGGRRSTG